VRRLVATVTLPALALALVGVGAGCGLSTNDKPESIAGTTVDSSTQRQQSTLAQPSGATRTVQAWFLDTDDAGTRLIARDREVALPATPASRVDALLQQPPDDAEREQGIWSAIPPDASLRTVPVQRGTVLELDFPDRVYLELHGRVAQGAFAQIVYTATALPGVNAVLFKRDGVDFPAVDGSGQARSDPLRKQDFTDFAPAPRRSARAARPAENSAKRALVSP
jgi:spore germination protein GerM